RLRSALRKLADIERIAARLGVGRASPRDLVALGRTLLETDALADLLASGNGAFPAVDGVAAVLDPGLSGALPPLLEARSRQMRGLRSLGESLTQSLLPDAPLVITDGGIIAAGVDAELDRLRAIGTDGRQWLADYQAREIQRTGIPSLKVGFNNVFGYYIEITNTHVDKA